MKKINVAGVRLFYGNHMDNKYNLYLYIGILSLIFQFKCDDLYWKVQQYKISLFLC